MNSPSATNRGCCFALLLVGMIVLSKTMAVQAARSQQDDIEELDSNLGSSENSAAEDFFYLLANTAREGWGNLWNQNSPALRHRSLSYGRADMEEDEDDSEEEERDMYLSESDPDSKSRRRGAYDVSGMRKSLQVRKVGNYQRGQDYKQRMRQHRRRQQRRKLMKTVERNRIHRVRYEDNNLNSVEVEEEELPPMPDRPNIVLIMADDLGFNDVPWHNPDVKAPNLLKLARQGIVLENHYVLPLCTPSRAALLTGKYPFRYGKQTGETSPLSPTGLNASITLLPQRLKNLGYKTHLIGKWHLGFCNWAYTPTWRGFDSFYGFYLGSQTYYTQYKKLGPKKGSPFWWSRNEVDFDYNYNRHPPAQNESMKEEQLRQIEEDKRQRDRMQGESITPNDDYDGGRDFRFNEAPLTNVSGTYSNELYATRAEEIIREHEMTSRGSNSPLFMMLSLQAVHGPVRVPLEYRRIHKDTTKNLSRRTFLGMVSALDSVVGRVVAQLKSSGLYDNTVIVFTTDNGGNIQAGGNNFPLRGSKGGVFEGGTRGVAFVHSPLLPKTGYKYTGMMHIVDWHETLLHLAKEGAAVPPRNSYLVKSLEDNEITFNRPEVFEVEEDKGDGMNMWRSILTNAESPRVSFVYNVRKRPFKGAIRRKNWKLIIGSGGRYDGWIPQEDVSAGTQDLKDGKCCSTWHSRMPNKNILLYNLKDDPLETTDVSELNPTVTGTLKSLLKMYAAQSRQPYIPRDDPLGHPSFYNGFFSPGWCQAVM